VTQKHIIVMVADIGTTARMDDNAIRRHPANELVRINRVAFIPCRIEYLQQTVCGSMSDGGISGSQASDCLTRFRRNCAVWLLTLNIKLK